MQEKILQNLSKPRKKSSELMQNLSRKLSGGSEPAGEEKSDADVTTTLSNPLHRKGSGVHEDHPLHHKNSKAGDNSDSGGSDPEDLLFSEERSENKRKMSSWWRHMNEQKEAEVRRALNAQNLFFVGSVMKNTVLPVQIAYTFNPTFKPPTQATSVT
jgi:hypothetical protein